MTNPNQMREVLLFVYSKMTAETNLSSKLHVADRTHKMSHIACRVSDKLLQSKVMLFSDSINNPLHIFSKPLLIFCNNSTIYSMIMQLETCLKKKYQ